MTSYLRILPFMRNTTTTLLALSVLALPVHAAEDDEWQFTLSPSFWGAGLSGDVATLPNAQPAEIDLSFSDIMDNLDMTLMGFFEARKGRTAFFAELFYIDVETDSAKTPGNLYSDGKYEQQLLGITLGGSYRYFYRESNIDLFAGARYWKIDNELSLSAGLLPANKTDEKKEWADLIAGVKTSTPLTREWSVNSWIGAAVAGESDKLYDLFLGLNYRFTPDLSMTGGYRYQELKYTDKAFLYDVVIEGPSMGLNYTF